MKSEVGSRNSELGSRNSELGSRNSELGSRKLEVGTKKSEIRSPYPAFVVYLYDNFIKQYDHGSFYVLSCHHLRMTCKLKISYIYKNVD